MANHEHGISDGCWSYVAFAAVVLVIAGILILNAVYR